MTRNRMDDLTRGERRWTGFWSVLLSLSFCPAVASVGVAWYLTGPVASVLATIIVCVTMTRLPYPGLGRARQRLDDRREAADIAGREQAAYDDVCAQQQTDIHWMIEMHGRLFCGEISLDCLPAGSESRLRTTAMFCRANDRDDLAACAEQILEEMDRAGQTSRPSAG